MGFLPKSCTRVYGLAFGKHAFEGIDCRQFLSLENRVQTANDGAVEVPPQVVFAIQGQCKPGRKRNLDKAVIRNPYPFQAAGGCQVETETKFDNGAN
jgi:hypothetical protein